MKATTKKPKGKQNPEPSPIPWELCLVPVSLVGERMHGVFTKGRYGFDEQSNEVIRYTDNSKKEIVGVLTPGLSDVCFEQNEWGPAFVGWFVGPTAFVVNLQQHLDAFQDEWSTIRELLYDKPTPASPNEKGGSQ